jgi:hypothetical protein
VGSSVFETSIKYNLLTFAELLFDSQEGLFFKGLICHAKLVLAVILFLCHRSLFDELISYAEVTVLR